ncbi:ABC-2 type transporter [Alkaliphilus metalliredigens QYMF]|uniref:ABC-2 type transporter n=1 Tax=Alkaliphilus metalliredigens (strain QYMF) TaxID=293826 RepID=A6TUH0_ALKMQ|nr:ABC transporter permease [Alkaliphilus metalliredigens]ABR49838.1 ABC-2 type transporter [Alkaliphilus metalliredigens QYMF]
MILRSSYFMLRRMLRGYLALIILLVTPLALITVLGMVAGNAMDEQLGVPVINTIAVTMILGFQLYGGFYTMEFIREDLISSKKWRMYSLPYQAHQHAFSILLTCIAFSALQGFTMVLFTQWFYGVDWGNIGFVLVVLLALSILSQLVFLNLVLGVKNYKNAERIGTAYGLVSMALAGVWFPMPDSGVLHFMSTYGNPLSLGENAVYAFMAGESMNRGALSIVILLVASVVMAIVATLIGRRKLA